MEYDLNTKRAFDPSDLYVALQPEQLPTLLQEHMCDFFKAAQKLFHEQSKLGQVNWCLMIEINQNYAWQECAESVAHIVDEYDVSPVQISPINYEFQTPIAKYRFSILKKDLRSEDDAISNILLAYVPTNLEQFEFQEALEERISYSIYQSGRSLPKMSQQYSIEDLSTDMSHLLTTLISSSSMLSLVELVEQEKQHSRANIDYTNTLDTGFSPSSIEVHPKLSDVWANLATAEKEAVRLGFKKILQAAARQNVTNADLASYLAGDLLKHACLSECKYNVPSVQRYEMQVSKLLNQLWQGKKSIQG